MTFVLILTRERRPVKRAQNEDELTVLNREGFMSVSEELRVEYKTPNEYCRGLHPDILIVDCVVDEEFYDSIICPMRDIDDIPVIYKRRPSFL